MTNATELPVIIGGLVTIVTGFFAIAKIMLSQASKDREADRLERQQLSKAIERMATSSAEVARATVKSAQEAKERNGHQAEHTVELGKLVAQGNKLTERVIKRLEKTAVIAAEDRGALTQQHVDTQTVDKQVINKKKGI